MKKKVEDLEKGDLFESSGGQRARVTARPLRAKNAEGGYLVPTNVGSIYMKPDTAVNVIEEQR